MGWGEAILSFFGLLIAAEALHRCRLWIASGFDGLVRRRLDACFGPESVRLPEPDEAQRMRDRGAL